jgi:hypothetical protein
MTMRWSLQELDCRELALGASDSDGLRWFFLLGWIDESPAAAEWDGASLRLSGNLLDAASVAAQVDHALADCAASEVDHSASLADTPGRALITLTDCCDGIYALETLDEMGRRQSW